MILDGERLTASLYGAPVDPREHLVRMYPALADRVPPLDHVVGNATPLVARVNHGLWIASCPCGVPKLPAPGCVVFTSTPLGFCIRCGNGATGRGWRPVEVPPLELRAAIEMVLLCRPNVGDRNWEPHETVADLVAQNREHGDPVPLPGTLIRQPADPDAGWREMAAPFGPLPRAAGSLGRRLARLVGRG